ncbi:MAG: FHA domain-containing protein [Deltaproteobacteria bacterium]|nr:FHA domain-containing protein [Deltaproteobacteria bacterium]
MPQLIITRQGTEESWNVPCDQPELGIGRAADNRIILASHGVSRRHAVVSMVGSEQFITDRGSGNGTLLNGAPIKTGSRYLLRTGDVITIDQFHLRVSRDDELEQSFNDITDSDMMEVKLLKKVMRALDKETLPSLEVMNGISVGKKLFFPDDAETLKVGRDPDCALAIEDYAVSRQHAQCVRDAQGWIVTDLRSKNGTYINQQRITTEVIHDGDRIAFGTVVCIYRNPREVNVEAVSAQVQAHRKATQKAIEAQVVAEEARVSDEGGPEEAADEAMGDDATGRETDGPPDVPAPQPHGNVYPPPQASRSFLDRLSPTEMGLLWTGIVVFLGTLILLVQVLR